METTDTVHENTANRFSGWIVLPLWLLLALGAAWVFFGPILLGRGDPGVIGIFCVPILFFLAKGFFILEPNVAAVMTFFGKYAGSVREDGFFWVNPFFRKQKMSLRAHNLNTPTLKVNDASGNPIEVAAVIVWRVYDTARAAFDVEDYVDYITVQSESAVRQVTSSRWYDGDENGENSLRSDLDSVARMLSESIQAHSSFAGLEILEARISHLAYAPEIAGAMLRRQQAVAVVAARKEIVEGAVSMVKLGVEQLERDGVVKLDEQARVKLVTNLMTVLVGDNEATPMVSVNGE